MNKQQDGAVVPSNERLTVLPDSKDATKVSKTGSLHFKASCSEKKKYRRILGIDPGLASTGWGIIDVIGNRFLHVAHGVVETAASTSHQVRLLEIYNRIDAVLRMYNPLEAGMESLYFAKNVTSALAVAEARGVVSLCFAQHTIPLSEYSPLTIKQCVVGSAKAEKKHVQEYVKMLLGLECIPKPDHAADALAAAITHVHSHPEKTIFSYSDI